MDKSLINKVLILFFIFFINTFTVSGHENFLEVDMDSHGNLTIDGYGNVVIKGYNYYYNNKYSVQTNLIVN